MWSLDFIRRKNHDKQGARGKKWRFFHNFATFVRERLPNIELFTHYSPKRLGLPGGPDVPDPLFLPCTARVLRSQNTPSE